MEASDAERKLFCRWSKVSTTEGRAKFAGVGIKARLSGLHVSLQSQCPRRCFLHLDLVLLPTTPHDAFLLPSDGLI